MLEIIFITMGKKLFRKTKQQNAITIKMELERGFKDIKKIGIVSIALLWKQEANKITIKNFQYCFEKNKYENLKIIAIATNWRTILNDSKNKWGMAR